MKILAGLRSRILHLLKMAGWRSAPSSAAVGPPRNVELEEVDGRTIVVRHFYPSDSEPLRVVEDFPDAYQHLYVPQGIGEPIPLYRGMFSLAAKPGVVYDGDIRLCWSPTARVMLRGEAPASYLDFFDDDSDFDSQWVRMADVVDSGDLLVNPPCEVETLHWSNSPGTQWEEDRVASPDIGDGSRMDALTFFLPNGWDCITGSRVRDASEPWRYWAGRVSGSGAGWEVTIDPVRGATGRKFWNSLRSSGQIAVTHVGHVRRTDRSQFSSSDVDPVLEAIRLGASLALGRYVGCVIPVGWLQGDPVWAYWHVGSIDTIIGVHSILDLSSSAAQINELISCMLKVSENRARMEVVRYAVSYQISASYASAELSVALPVSALQMLGYYWLVEVQRKVSRTQWKSMKTEPQIKSLLDDIGIDYRIPSNLTYLLSVQQKLGLYEGQPRTGLRCVVDMRNTVIHPTSDLPSRWDYHEWSEAAALAQDLLRLAILRVIDYNGSARLATQASKSAGVVRNVPWATPPQP